MARTFINQPTLAADFIMPESVKFDVPGNSIDGGRNGEGESISIELSGGGEVVATYSNCFIHDAEQHEYINWLGARLNGGVRFINVPVLTDWNGPFPVIAGIPTPIVGGIPHSDGAMFADGSGYSQATVWGELTEDAALNAGIISLRLYGASRPLRWSDWFSILHDAKGWRAYRYWQVLGQTNDSDPVYTIAITPPLRETASAGTRIEFARPRCVMKFAAGFTLPWEVQGFYESSPTIKFSEAF